MVAYTQMVLLLCRIDRYCNVEFSTRNKGGREKGYNGHGVRKGFWEGLS